MVFGSVVLHPYYIPRSRVAIVPSKRAAEETMQGAWCDIEYLEEAEMIGQEMEVEGEQEEDTEQGGMAGPRAHDHWQGSGSQQI